MIIVWIRDRPLVDRASVALLYGVSPRTVRRRCPVVLYHARTGAALVDALAAEKHLEGIYPRGRATEARTALLAARTEGTQ